MTNATNSAELKTERLHMLISPAELTAIEDFRFDNRIGTRAEAVRRLIEIGLEASRKEKDDS